MGFAALNPSYELGYVVNLSNHNAFFDTTISFFDGILNAAAGIFTKDLTALLTRVVAEYAGALAVYGGDGKLSAS